MNDQPPATLWRDTPRVRVFEIGADGLMTPAALLNRMQDAAAAHAEALGFGRSDLGPRGLAWVLVRLTLNIASMPDQGRRIVLETWPSVHASRLARREFALRAADGALLAQASSEWAMIDIAKRAMAVIPEELAARFPADAPPALELPSTTPPRLNAAGHEAQIHVRRSDLDENGHANNVRFLEWSLEALPDDFLESHKLHALSLSFRAEARRGQTIVSACDLRDTGDGPVAVHALRRPEDGRELARALTSWTKAKR